MIRRIVFGGQCILNSHTKCAAMVCSLSNNINHYAVYPSLMLTYAEKLSFPRFFFFLEFPCYVNIKKDILLIVIHIKYSFNSNLRSYDICRCDSATTKPRIIETDVIVLPKLRCCWQLQYQPLFSLAHSSVTCIVDWFLFQR